MESVDLILRDASLITMNDELDVYTDGAVAIRGDRIVALGDSSVICNGYRGAEVVSCDGQYILPGLINVHTHIPMTLLRGLADDLRLDVWLIGYIMPVEREFVNPEFCQLGATLACAEMIRGGITCFGDMYYFESDVAEAVAKTGMRAVLGETILKFPAPDAENYTLSLEYTRKFIERWLSHPRITPAIAPHAPYSTTDEIMALCRELALEHQVPIFTHLAETPQEVEESQRDFGQSVIRRVATNGLLDARTVAAHCVAIDDDEIHLLQQKGVAVAHNPSANTKLSSGIAPVTALLRAGVTVALGTDGPASNNDLDMFEEMRLATFLAKTITGDPTSLPAWQTLKMATQNGAKALGLDTLCGSLEVGKRADLIVIDGQRLHNFPHYSSSNSKAFFSQLVYAAKSADVRHTIVDGTWLMRDRQLLTIDEQVLYPKAQGYANRVGEFLASREGDVLHKLVAISLGIERGETYEVQVKAYATDPWVVEELLDHEDVEVQRAVHYRQYDTYFHFSDPKAGILRYREDDLISGTGEVTSVRSRLTYTSPLTERRLLDTAVLSHSRFYSQADRPLRFYQEYFKEAKISELAKERRRWQIRFREVSFFLHVDRITQPKLPQHFIELKSRTWSSEDALEKVHLIQEMLNILGIEREAIIAHDYVDFPEIG